MSIPWKTLEDGTESLTTLTTTGQNQVETVSYSGLKVSLSTLNGKFPPTGGGEGLSVYVDTLVIDAPNFTGDGISVIARSVDVSMLCNQDQMTPMVLLPSTHCFVVAGQIAGNEAWEFNTEAQPTAIQTASVGIETLKPFLLSVDDDGTLSCSQMTQAAALPNSLGRPAALNSLKASFVAATILLETADAENTTTAKSMLQWVVSCCETIVSLGNAAATPVKEPSFDQLRVQAAALLVTINVRNGVYYAPPLVPEYFKDKITALIETLATYENQIQTLTTQQEIKQAIADVSGTLQDNAIAVAGAYQAQLDGIDANLKTLLAGINTLQGQYLAQESTAAAWVDLETAMTDADEKAFLKAVMGTTVSAVKVGLAANPEDPDPGDIVDGVIEGISDGLDAVESASKNLPQEGNTLLSAAQDLLNQQNEMTISAWASYQLWLEARGETSLQIPVPAGVLAVDPQITWQNYIDAAEAELENIKNEYPDAAPAAVNYLSSLKALTQFGMGIDANLVAYTAQLAEGVSLTAPLNANKTIEEEWKSLQEKSESEDDQLLALKGLVTTQASAIQRSIYASYRLYASAYFYRNLKAPPEVVSVSMSSKQLTTAFNGISSWTADASNQKVTLPSEDATISLEFPIRYQTKVRDGKGLGAAAAHDNIAFLTPAAGSKPASLSFGFPISSSTELATTLGHEGKVAIWIKEARVVIKGATPNAKQNIILTLSTSGSYVNGFGPKTAYSFVNGGVTGEYAYRADNKKSYIAWKIPDLVYAKPTPYTTWKIDMDADGGDVSDATSVVLNLKVALMTPPDG